MWRVIVLVCCTSRLVIEHNDAHLLSCKWVAMVGGRTLHRSNACNTRCKLLHSGDFTLLLNTASTPLCLLPQAHEVGRCQ
jgi:hypothetical protein